MLSKASTLRVALLLVIALLGAQWGAEAHTYSHLRHGSHSGEPYDSSGRPCSDCSAFAPLLAAAGAPASAPALVPEGTPATPGVSVVSLIFSLPTSAFRSRAPPSLP
jgi:hypothetical protein